MKNNAVEIFNDKLTQLLGKSFTLSWDTNTKGVVYGWCKLDNPADIIKVAEVVAEFKGRVMTISPMITTINDKSGQVKVKYHFYFDVVNCTVTISLKEDAREVISVTPVLKSADWHEREMRELYNIKLIGHPNPAKLFLDPSIQMKDNTMIPLSEAMNGASTNTLWEKVMKSNSREEAKTNE